MKLTKEEYRVYSLYTSGFRGGFRSQEKCFEILNERRTTEKKKWEHRSDYWSLSIPRFHRNEIIKIDNEEKKLKSLKDKRRIFTQVLSLDEKELEDYRIDINNIKFIIDQIKREIKLLNGNIEGLMYDVSRNFDTIKKKKDKLKDKKSN